MNEPTIKLLPLSEAASLIRDGTRIHLGGMAVHNHPMAFVRQLLRQGTKDLTVVSHVSSGDVDMLIGAGRVKRLEFSYVGLEARRPVSAGRLRRENSSYPSTPSRWHSSDSHAVRVECPSS
jgi:glutaconate CoA-transferase subunit A